MNLPGTQGRRTADVISNTIVSAVITICATILGLHHVLSPEGVLGAFGMAAAVGGLPIVVKRTDHGDQ